MLLTGKDTLEVIKGNNRQFKASVIFSFLSIKSPTAIKIKAPNAQTGSVVDKIVYPYLSHIKNRFFTKSRFKNQFPFEDVPDKYNRIFPSVLNRYGGQDKYVQVENVQAAHVGYIGAIADKDGNVNDTITLWVPNTDIENITLRTNPDRIIKDATIKLYTKNQLEKPAATCVITNNKKSFLLLPIVSKDVTHIELTVTKATANKRIWIVSFFAGFEYALTEKHIVKIKHQQKKSENKEGSIGRLYFNTIDLTLSNIERIFDKENKNSPIVNYLTSTATFSVALTLKQGKMQNPFVIELGTFTVTDFTSKLSEAQATIKGTDFIGSQKEKEITLGIIENKTAYEVFKTIALKLGLEPTGIDEALKQINYSLLPLNGTVSKILNRLCSDTNVFCTTRANVFVATLLKSKHATLRYPSRYFALNEFREKGTSSSQSLVPNVINLSYSTYEYENGVFIKDKKVLFYNKDIIQKTKEWETMPLTDYIDNVFITEDKKPVSYEKTFNANELPENFHHIEISDEFLYKSFEYKIDTKKDEATNKTESVTVKIWSYETHEDTEQCTIMLCVKEKPQSQIIDSQDFIVYPHGNEYTKGAELKAAPKSKNDSAEIERRNAPNAPEIFSVETTGDIQIDRIEIGNYFVTGYFEFYMTRTEKGVEVKAWNYAEAQQTLTVNIYGVRLKKSEQKITIQARNEENIKINGEIVKNISIDGVQDKKSATEILRTAMRYYKELSGSFTAEAWADPRIQLYDFLAFKKLRYPSYSQGIVDEITLEYAGYLTQTLSLKETNKHNRDCRVFAAFVADDRPVQNDTQTNWV